MYTFSRVQILTPKQRSHKQSPGYPFHKKGDVRQSNRLAGIQRPIPPKPKLGPNKSMNTSGSEETNFGSSSEFTTKCSISRLTQFSFPIQIWVTTTKLVRLEHPLQVAAYDFCHNTDTDTDPTKPSRTNFHQILPQFPFSQTLFIGFHHLFILFSTTIKDISVSDSFSISTTYFYRQQIVIDNRFCQEHNEGDRAPFSIIVTALIKIY